MSNELPMGLFNNFTATLQESVPYINTIDAPIEEAQTFKLLPQDLNAWPLDIVEYFTNNSVFIYMTFFNVNLGISAVYKMFFDSTMLFIDNVLHVKGLLIEQPAFKRDIALFDTWPSTTLISNTANVQTLTKMTDDFTQIAANMTNEVSALAGKITNNETAILDIQVKNSQQDSAIQNNVQTITNIQQSVLDNTAAIDTNTAQLSVFNNKYTITPTANKVPLANSSGKISADWVDTLTSATIGSIEDSIISLNTSVTTVTNMFSVTAAPNKVPQANTQGTFDSSWKMSSNEGVLIPGTVCMFSGTFGGSDGKRAIPLGSTTADEKKVLCDGTNGTPDLRNKFIRGGTGKNNGVTGGSTVTQGHTLTTSQMPTHSHTRDVVLTSGNADYVWGVIPYIDANQLSPSSSTGGGQSHTHNQNLPPYYTLAFYMQLP